MKKVLLVIILLLFCGCSSDNITNNDEKNNLSSETSSEDIEYLQTLIDSFEEGYFEGKTFMRTKDEVILGYNCVVFKVGIQTKEKFTTEDWYAVDNNKRVYQYDVVTDNWLELVKQN